MQQTQSEHYFTVDLPWDIPAEVLPHVDNLEIDVIKLQQHIIDEQTFKLNQRQGFADVELKAKYEALLNERTEILESRSRAYAETDYMRDKRNESDELAKTLAGENESLKIKLNSVLSEREKLQKALKLANDEIEGIPTLVQNKVKAELARLGGIVNKKELDQLKSDLERVNNERSLAADKNKALNKKYSQLEKEHAKQGEKVQGLTQLTESLIRQNEASEAGVLNADDNYKNFIEHLDEQLHYIGMLNQENEQVKNDNLYLTLMKEHDDLKPVFSADGWKAYILSRVTALFDGGIEPDHSYGLAHVMNSRGEGHIAFVDTNGQLQIPESVHEAIRLPKEHHDALVSGIKSLSVSEIEAAVANSTARTRNIVRNARLLDLDWTRAVEVVDIGKRLSKFINQDQLVNVVNQLENAKKLIPRNQAAVNRVNKRFGTNFVLANAGKGKSKRKGR
ncbi:hypothetical protein [Vibrio marisflavi]|uniref:Chromosome partition protein Smc n=1 Tax=Vibrio marisflavi CECT 7928 TaxID=634439 RepID=A0ABN8EBM7_9VIBR|nr:hypothetical protein [Vibrio marisflavi]CAH0543148.1 hypothetical protein VMF7928_04424 [Vibrio marisflavi CECT 7928]